MDTRTGNIYELENGQSHKDLAEKLGTLESDIVPLKRLPNLTCSICKGSGKIRKGLFSRRWKPCKCTL